MTPSICLPELIADSLQKLRIGRRELVIRLGYTDLEKGIRHLDDVLAGQFATERAKRLIRLLPDALNADPDQVREAIENSRSLALSKCEENYRSTFRPHGIAVTERDRPSSIWLAAITGAEARRHITIEDLSDPASYPNQVIAKLPAAIPGYDRTIGFFVNYSPDHAIEYDLSGSAIREMDRAYRIGTSVVSLG